MREYTRYMVELALRVLLREISENGKMPLEKQDKLYNEVYEALNIIKRLEG